MEKSPLRFLDYNVSLMLSEEVRNSQVEEARKFHYKLSVNENAEHYSEIFQVFDEFSEERNNLIKIYHWKYSFIKKPDILITFPYGYWPKFVCLEVLGKIPTFSKNVTRFIMEYENKLCRVNRIKNEFLRIPYNYY